LTERESPRESASHIDRVVNKIKYSIMSAYKYRITKWIAENSEAYLELIPL